MKKLMYLVIIPLLMVGMGCSDDEKENNVLKGTRWKLAEFATSEDQVLQEAKPIDCNTCYTLEFYENNSAGGWGAPNSIFGEFHISSDNLTFTNMNSTNVGLIEEHDEEIYFEILLNTNTYSIIENNLYLYNSDKANYLIYKPYNKDMSIP